MDMISKDRPGVVGRFRKERGDAIDIEFRLDFTRDGHCGLRHNIVPKLGLKTCVGAVRHPCSSSFRQLYAIDPAVEFPRYASRRGWYS
jgi:hypothetical protein